MSFKKNELEDLQTEDEEVNTIIEKMFAYYSIEQAGKILSGNSDSISDFKIKLYENHQKTLSYLKTLFKGIEVYKNIFNKHGIYEKFIGNGKESEPGKKYKSGHKRDLKAYQDGFIKELNKILKNYFKDSETKETFLANAENKGTEFKQFADYLLSEDPTFDDVEKGYTLYTPTNFEYSREVMNQLHLGELRKILELSQLNENIKNNIETLLTFKAEYFLGPLSKNIPGNNQWLVKKQGFENEKVTPFNLDKVVDKIETNNAFITRMQRSCSYLVGKKTMQQETILYQDYIFYNTVNKLCFGENLTPIASDEKAKLYQYLLQNNSNQLTLKTIEKLLEKKVSKGMDLNADKPTLPLSLSAHRKFREIFGFQNQNPADYIDSKKVMFFDEVINKFSHADKNNIEAKLEIIKKLSENIPEFKELEINKDVKLTQILTKENFISDSVNVDALNKLMQVKSNKAGKLSFEFLSELNFVNEIGEWKPLIAHLRESNLNLQELIYLTIDGKNPNLVTIAEENIKKEKELDLSDPNYLNQYLADRFVPPLSRRPIIQANKLIDEIIEIMNGQLPSHITLEFTRTNNQKDKNKRTTSRREQIKKQIESLKDFEYKQSLLDELSELHADPELKSDKLYLYFAQLGKDMYTGKPIDIRNLEAYDIDHIFPQSKITDESIHNNKVLTSKDENRKKADKYPISLEIQANMGKFWKYLKESKLITAEKYERLIRKTELNDNEISEFENRQKNILDWVNKELINFLKDHKFKHNKEFDAVYSKSSYVDDFRKTFDFLKFRNLNKFHHAHDAYLNDVLAKIFKSRHKYHIDGTVEFKDKKVPTILERAIPGKTLKVQGEEVKFLKYFENIFNSKDQLITKMTRVKSSGAFWNETICGKNEGTIPIKQAFKDKNIAHYGSPSTAFFTIIEFKVKDKKGKEKSSLKIVPVPIYHCAKFYDENINYQYKVFNLKKFKNYIQEEFTAENETASIFSKISEKPIIPIGTLCEVDGVKVRLAGKTGNNCTYHNTCNLTIKQKDNYLYYRWLDKQFENIFKEKEKNEQKTKNGDAELVDIFKKYSYLPKNNPNKAIILSKENNLKLMEEIYKTVQKLYEDKKVTNTVQKRFLIDNNFNLSAYLSKFSELDFFEQVKLLSDIITVLIKSNVSNSGKILDLGVNIEKKEDKNKLETSISDFHKSVEIKYSFSIIKQSITGFNTKKIIVYKK